MPREGSVTCHHAHSWNQVMKSIGKPGGQFQGKLKEIGILQPGKLNSWMFSLSEMFPLLYHCKHLLPLYFQFTH